ncbi:sigma 54-interacting transcriptional regulator [Lacticaseibacillus paracasei]|uniref:sigma 54-interacting transcriptional regulator n=1 Tax=Lacticaseibacillus paracasei TaxID=1597 RepID=UPI002ADEB75D|nr:sigma 54-interacting transcriptional regulator [Lacticaseibacillus paracasei]MEA0974159.1 sigma 54-interacting transcriptional regulator [Lacticaseibacillus paracasei]
MSVKSDIFKLLVTHKLNWSSEDENNLNTAQAISQDLHIQRNTASHYLNELVKDGHVVKINSRPVLFFSKDLIERTYKGSIGNQYTSLQALKVDLEARQASSIFDQVIGSRGSLHNQIQQLEAAATYPQDGLPVLLSGPTGVGKSYLAYVYYQYCHQKGFVAPKGQFVHLNCAEYADNPELLSSILFGYVKGAFTGADRDNPGLFDEADNGMLFLDEVHRLNAKGQEKLFSYFDRGLVNPVGATTKGHIVHTRLVMATTESIKSNFLQTFIRRIPIHINIPSLLSRPQGELEELILSFYKAESIKIKQSILVDGTVRHALMVANYENNVGDLKNFVTLSVAKALVMQDEKKDELVVDLNCLPISIRVAELTQKSNCVNVTDIVINQTTDLQEISTYRRAQSKINQALRSIVELANDKAVTRQALFRQVNTLTDMVVWNQLMTTTTDQYQFLKKGIAMILSALKEQFHIDFLGNLETELAKYLYLRDFYSFDVDESLSSETVLTRLITQQNKLLPKIVGLCLRMLTNTLNYEADVFDRIVVTVYLSSSVLNADGSTIRCVIIAHGESTASSMAEVVNRLVGRSLVDSINMPYDMQPSEIGRELSGYIDECRFLQGLVLLVDMGSLTEIASRITSTVDFPIGLVTNTSTGVALEVAEEIQTHQNIEKILENVQGNTVIKTSLKYPEQAKTDLVLTCCATGQGTAAKVKALLEESFPSNLGIEVLAYDESQLENHSIREMISSNYHCLAVVGTLDPLLKEVPFISLESLIGGTDFDRLIKLLSPEDNQTAQLLGENIVRNFTIERVLGTLTILDARTVLAAVDTFIDKYEHLAHRHLSNSTKVALYVHISGLVERLIRNEPVNTYPQISEFIAAQKQEFVVIKQSFSVMETQYSVTIPMTEIAYVYDLLSKVPD